MVTTKHCCYGDCKSGSRILEKNSEIFFIVLNQTRNRKRPSKHTMLKLKAASSDVVWLQTENRILENNIKISCQPFLKKKKKKKKPVKQPVTQGWWGGGRGGGGVTGVIVVRVCEPAFQNLPHRLKCWPIHILPFDFCTHLLLVVRQISQSIHWILNTKRTSSLENSLSEKYVCQKNGAFHIGIQKNRVIHILSVEKRGPVIYLAALKKGAIRHAHPYYAIYRKLHPPPPTHTHTHTHTHTRDRESPSKPKTLHHFNVESTKKMMIRCSTLVWHTCSPCVYGSFWGIDAKYSKQKDSSRNA